MAKTKILVALVVSILLSNLSFGMYDAKTGRFMQRDPIGTDPGNWATDSESIHEQYLDGMNLYEYVGSRVLNSVDPSGLAFQLVDFQASCGGLCNSSTYIDRRPIPDKVRNRMKQGKWVDFGFTKNPEWNYSLTTAEYGLVSIIPFKFLICCPGQKFVFPTSCQMSVRAWFYDPPEGLHDSAGNTPEQHEYYHINSAKSLWSELTSKTSSVITCMKAEKADCYKKALKSYSDYLLIKWKAENFRFDCNVYAGSTNPEDGWNYNHRKHKLCNLADKYEELEERRDPVVNAKLQTCDDMED